MTLEQSAARLNSLYFLPEFTFANATFTPHAGTELELADGLIWLDDTAVIFQMKERALSGKNDQSSVEKWFQKRVVGEATKQIRDTIKYLDANSTITAKNSRGQPVTLNSSKLKTLHKVVLYSEPTQSFSRSTHHVSRTAGFIHLLPLTDYEGLVRTLCTPSELFEYLAWRETLLTKWTICSELPEQALIGHYLWGDPDKTPSLEDVCYLYTVEQEVESFDLTGILHRFLDRTYDGIGKEETSYHRIIAEVAKLDRSGLKAFKERFKLSMDKAKENAYTAPFRFSNPATDCGFVFIPLEDRFRDKRRPVLAYLTRAHKHEMHLSKSVGLIFLADPDGWSTIDWCIVEAPWHEDTVMDEFLAKSSPFRPTKPASGSRYQFIGLTPEI
jgi:hypothetical protein